MVFGPGVSGRIGVAVLQTGGMIRMHVICRGPRGHAGKGHLRAGLVSLAVSAAALCLTGLSPASAASAAPAGRHPAGTVLAWGDNSFAELGDGSTAPSSTPVRVHLPAHTRVTAVAAGEGYGLALTSRGRVLAWGWNNYGELGDGDGDTTADSSTPVAVHVPAGTRVTAIAAGESNGLALTSSGRVLAWGYNYQGESGDGSTSADSSTPVWVHLPAHTRITAVAAGDFYNLALTSRGRVLAWGNNYAGALGDGTMADSSTPVAVDLPHGIRVTAIAAGWSHSLALTSAGRLLAWGDNSSGELGNATVNDSLTPIPVDLPTGTRITAIAANDEYNLVLTSAGRVLAWGDNSFGELGDGSTSVYRFTPAPVDLPAGTRITAISAGYSDCLALTSDGRVLAWGNNIDGDLEDGSTASTSTPAAVDLPAGTRVTAISAGFFDSLALTA